jgi:gas vesicle protein
MASLLLIGAALGGTAMYLFDPDRGRRRRALIRDQAIHIGKTVSEAADAGWQDLSNRAGAAPRQAMSLWRSAPVTDDVLAERVRSRMGRYVSYPDIQKTDRVDASAQPA